MLRIRIRGTCAKKFDDAIAVFKLNTQLYPNSWNAYDSLAEALADDGQEDFAKRRHNL